jgi:hypothetical protein
LFVLILSSRFLLVFLFLSFAHMDVHWRDLPIRTCQSFLKAFHRLLPDFSPRSLSFILYRLISVVVNLYSLPSHSLFLSFVVSFGKLEIHWSSLVDVEALLKAIANRSSQYDGMDVRYLIYGLVV